MKTFLTAAVALSLLAGTAASAQPYGRDHRDDRDNNRYEQRYDRDDRRDYRDGRRDHRNDRWDDRRDNRQHWRQGQRLPSAYYGRSYYVDHRRYQLRQPPRGYQWVRVNNDYIMVSLATGLIASIIANSY